MVEVRVELRVRVRLDYVDFNRNVCCAIREAFTMICSVWDGGLYRGVFLHSSKYYFDVSLQDLTPMMLSNNKHPGALRNIWVSVTAYLSASIEEVFAILWAMSQTIQVQAPGMPSRRH
jgi:hypothetical protein